MKTYFIASFKQKKTKAIYLCIWKPERGTERERECVSSMCRLTSHMTGLVSDGSGQIKELGASAACPVWLAGAHRVESFSSGLPREVNHDTNWFPLGSYSFTGFIHMLFHSAGSCLDLLLDHLFYPIDCFFFLLALHYLLNCIWILKFEIRKKIFLCCFTITTLYWLSKDFSISLQILKFKNIYTKNLMRFLWCSLYRILGILTNIL